ncbi:MAG: outer membrane lipoprotein-sorting protein [Bacteroidales bacterium]|nr:outer membrane lipoprotein-sorting protein [Bacteroidales bacterium]
MNYLILILAVLSAAAMSQEPEALEVLSRSREASLTSSLSATVNLTIKEKNGSLRSRTILMRTKSYEEGQEKRYVRFTEPADVRGTTMIIIDNKSSQDEMWIYLPALKKTRRLVSSEKGKSFMSSEFTNADMSSPALADFINSYAEPSSPGALWIIESRPVNEEKADEYGFSRKISYIDRTNYQVKRREFYDFSNKLYKVIEVSEVKMLPGNKYLITNMAATNMSNGRSSDIRIANAEAGSAVDDSVFNVQNIDR